GGNSATIACLFQYRFAIFARLAQIDVDCMNLVSLFLQPTENDRCIQSARVSQHTTRHEICAPNSKNVKNSARAFIRATILERCRTQDKGCRRPVRAIVSAM